MPLENTQAEATNSRAGPGQLHLAWISSTGCQKHSKTKATGLQGDVSTQVEKGEERIKNQHRNKLQPWLSAPYVIAMHLYPIAKTRCLRHQVWSTTPPPRPPAQPAAVGYAENGAKHICK